MSAPSPALRASSPPMGEMGERVSVRMGDPLPGSCTECSSPIATANGRIRARGEEFLAALQSATLGLKLES